MGVNHHAGGKVELALPEGVHSAAVFSKCGQYRYELHRRWKLDEPIRSIMFLMMNPSIATVVVDDPTVRKCRLYADRWGYNHLVVANIMAYRATNPKTLLTIDDPDGPANLMTISRLLCGDAFSHYCGKWEATKQFPMSFPAPHLICAWGCIPKRLAWAERNAMWAIANAKPHILRLNKAGKPWHPLYLPNDTVPVPWEVFAN